MSRFDEFVGSTKATLRSVDETTKRIEKHLVRMDERIDAHSERINSIETCLKMREKSFKRTVAIIGTIASAVGAAAGTLATALTVWIKYRG